MLQLSTKYFWKRHKALCLFVVALLGSGGVLNVNALMEMATTERVEIRQATPRTAEPTGANFSLHSQATAGEQQKKGVPIVWGGVVWGYADTNFITHKLLGYPIILIKDKRTNAVVEVEATGLDEQNLKQYKKGY